jgi:oligopeptide/dipeptide ABC transporter ATP-binding protein
MPAMPLIEVRELQVEFRANGGWVRAVDGVSFAIEPGETVCLVGESGSGKSVTALSLARLLPTPPARYPGGSIRLDGREVLAMREADLCGIRGRQVGYVFQEPGASLNPVHRVGAQVLEVLRLHRPERATNDEIIRLFQRVGIPDPARRVRDYPHQFSGGMQQRVAIAVALAAQPRLLVADEPTTALDVTIQAQVLDLLRELKQELGMAILLITHNLGLVGGIADRVLVMYAGQIVEAGPTRGVLQHPRHPYTRALIRSVPQLGANTPRLAAIPGAVPRLGAWPAGCRFHPRCGLARAACAERVPDLGPVAGAASHHVRCPFWNE